MTPGPFPTTPPVKDEVKQPPYYLSLKMPDQDKPAFQLTSSFIPQVVNGNARNVLYGFLAADSDAGNQKGVKADSYGQLQAPADPAGDPGPRPRPGAEQVQLRPHRFAGPQPAAPGCVGGAQRQPADPAGRRRHGLRPARLSAVHGGDLLPDAAAGPGGVRRQDRVRAHAGRGPEPAVRRKFGCRSR